MNTMKKVTFSGANRSKEAKSRLKNLESAENTACCDNAECCPTDTATCCENSNCTL